MNPVSTNPAPLVAAEKLTRLHRRGEETVRALDGVSFTIARGEFVAITGPSGAGKTTLLNLLGCMDRPTAGSLRLDGREVQQITEAEQTQFRRAQIGFVFQNFGLIPTLTAAENVALPALFARRDGRAHARELLDHVGLGHRRNHRPAELSGGELQRVAIARALINRPSMLLADEPAGNLDSQAGAEILNLLRELHRERLTVIVVTHNATLATAADRVLTLRDGRLEGANGEPVSHHA